MNLQIEKEDGENRMFKITFASGNMHKVEEINLIAKDYNIEFVLPEGEFNPIEDGSTFLENAFCKAKYASKSNTTELYLADDSGLCVEALNGEPGIYSARYAPTPKERIEKLLCAMKDKTNRSAKFKCAMVLCDKEGNIVFETEKECVGEIMHSSIGEGGFGYDPIFFVKSKQTGMAQLTPEEKAQVSHRARALNSVLEWLKQNKM